MNNEQKIVFHNRIKDPFTIVDNRLARLNSLSYEAKGLYLTLKSFGATIYPSIKYLMDLGGGIGKNRLYKILDELIKNKLIIRRQTRGKKGFMGKTEYILLSLDDNYAEIYRQFIPNVQSGTPNNTLDQNLVNYVNGLGNSDLNAANPWDNAMGVNSTAQDMQAIDQGAINSESATAALDSTEAQTATTAGHLISTQARSANGLDAERLNASADGKIIELLSEILQNQAVENQANAAQQAERLRAKQQARYERQNSEETNKSLATSFAAGW